MAEARPHEHVEVLLAQARRHLEADRLAEAADTLERAIAELDSGRGTHAGPSIDVLTPADIRVSRMAASGMKNREIADALMVSIKAIEYHLANTYRKLGIRGRTELTRMFNWATPLLALVDAAV